MDKSSSSFQITDDISRAETLPVDVYGDLAWYECANFIPYANLQLGVGKSKDDSFALPKCTSSTQPVHDPATTGEVADGG